MPSNYYPEKSALVARFRIYYNHTIHPELLRLEKKRNRLIRLLLFSLVLLVGLFLIAHHIHVLAFTLFLTLPAGVYIAWLLWLFHKFRLDFKPRIVNLILDFIDDQAYIDKLTYEPANHITRDAFLGSHLFATDAPYFKGEDLISGLIRALPFSFSELSVKEYSRVRSRLDPVFRGVFLKVDSNIPFPGMVLILPRHLRPFLTATLRAANKKKAREVDNLHHQEFEKIFITFATPNAPLRNLLSPEMQQALLQHHKQTGRDVYISFVSGSIYFALAEPRDLLEPALFASNLHFEAIYTFFSDIQLLLDFIDDYDKHR